MYRIAVCDDDAYEITKTKKYIEEVMTELGQSDYTLSAFSSSDEFLSYIERVRNTKKGENVFDLLFSDVVMPGKNGIELGQTIRNMGMNTPIVYTSSFRDYAFDSYAVRAFDYLLKPIDKKKLTDVLIRAMQIEENKKSLETSVRTKEGTQSVPVSKIMYVEYSARCIEYHLSDGTVLTTIYNRGKFEESLGTLPEQNNFVQTHKSYFVNLDYVHEMRTNDLVLDDGEIIPISRNQKADLKERYLGYFTNWDQK